jgi:hypothetical protein
MKYASLLQVKALKVGSSNRCRHPQILPGRMLRDLPKVADCSARPSANYTILLKHDCATFLGPSSRIATEQSDTDPKVNQAWPASRGPGT